MTDSDDSGVVSNDGYDVLEEDELIEDALQTTHVDLPDPDDPDSEPKGGAPAEPRKRWKRRRRVSESTEEPEG